MSRASQAGPKYWTVGPAYTVTRLGRHDTTGHDMLWSSPRSDMHSAAPWRGATRPEAQHGVTDNRGGEGQVRLWEQRNRRTEEEEMLATALRCVRGAYIVPTGPNSVGPAQHSSCVVFGSTLQPICRYGPHW